jgi:uncharacterized protein (UPF0261 family)
VTPPGFIAILATLDTKDAEAAFVRDEIARRGRRARVVDVGLTPGNGADVSAVAVAEAAGWDLAALRAERRDVAISTMANGASRILRQWQVQASLAGVIGLGGNQGTALASAAMRSLPIGVPKLVVSTVASGDVRGYVGDSDIMMSFSVGDLLGGPNELTSGVLRRAAAAMVGMAGCAGDQRFTSRAEHVVAVTAFGNTQGAVVRIMEELRAAGVRAVPFHASGASGSAMERLVEDGHFHAVVDLTTHELLAELHPEDIYRPVRPGRLTAAGRRGIPQVVAPGGLEYYCFGGRETIPARYRDRPTHYHNTTNTNVRATADELCGVASLIASRLNAAQGPVAVFIPLEGWSAVGSPGGVLYDKNANMAFLAALRAQLAPTIILREFDCTINDPLFATAMAQMVLKQLGLKPLGTFGSQARRPREQVDEQI